MAVSIQNIKMSLLSFNDEPEVTPSYSNETNIVFEPPSLISMNDNDKTEGYTNYIYSHGNSKLNAAIDNLTKENYNIKSTLQKAVYSNSEFNPEAAKNLISMEEKASNAEVAEKLFAMELLKNIKLEIKQTEEEIAKYRNIIEKLTNEINDFLD